MVEYAIGIGCVISVCLLVLGGLGFGAGDMARQVLININDPQAQTVDPSPGTGGGIFTNGVSGKQNTPWNPQ
jgi:hypothetical protein